MSEPVSNFYFILFIKKWGTFRWSSVSHQECWKYMDDLKDVRDALVKDIKGGLITNTNAAERLGSILEIDEQAKSYCNGCTQRGMPTYRVPGTNWWV